MIEARILGRCHRVELTDGYGLQLEPYTCAPDMVANQAMLHLLDLGRDGYTGMIKA